MNSAVLQNLLQTSRLHFTNQDIKSIICQHTEASPQSAYIQTEKHLVFLSKSCCLAATKRPKLINFQWELATFSDMSDSDRWQQDEGVSSNTSKLRKVWQYANEERSSNYQWESTKTDLQLFKMVTVTSTIFNWSMFFLHTILLFLHEKLFRVCTIKGSS